MCGRSDIEAVRVAVLASGAGSTFASLVQARNAGALAPEICLLVDIEYDTGPVIAAQSVPLKPDDDVATLGARVQLAERELLIQTLNQWIGGRSQAWSRIDPARSETTPLLWVAGVSAVANVAT